MLCSYVHLLVIILFMPFVTLFLEYLPFSKIVQISLEHYIELPLLCTSWELMKSYIRVKIYNQLQNVLMRIRTIHFLFCSSSHRSKLTKVITHFLCHSFLNSRPSRCLKLGLNSTKILRRVDLRLRYPLYQQIETGIGDWSRATR